MICVNLKNPNKPILVKNKEKQSRLLELLCITMLKTLDSFLIFARLYEAKSGKESTMDQELANYNKVYEIAKYNMRRMCVTIKKHSVNKLPYIQIRLLAEKENEAMKEVA